MLALATTTVSVLRGTMPNAAGDQVDNDTPAATGVLAGIVDLGLSRTQQSRGGAISAFAGQRYDGQTPRDLRAYTVRVPADTVVSIGDRLRDENSGTVYLVDGRGETANLTRVQDLRLDCRRVA